MEFEITSFSISIFTSIIFLYLLQNIITNKQKSKLPPGPRKLPIIGNLHQLSGSHPHRRLTDLAKIYGPLMHLQIGQRSAVVVSSAEIAEKIMKTHDLTFASKPYNYAANIFSYNASDIAFAPYGDYWRRLKKICTVELLTAKQVMSFGSIRKEEASDLISWIGSRAGSPINLTQKIYSLSHSVICRAAFGKRGHDEEKYLMVLADILKLVGRFSVVDLFPSSEGLLLWVTGMKTKIENLHCEADRIMESIIDERRRRKTNTTKEDVQKNENLLDVLFRVQEDGDDGFRLTDANIKAVIMDIISGGTDTSATTINWVMSELMNNPISMMKAQTEVREVVCRSKKFDETSINEMKYLKAVVKETLRLYPPFALIPRESREKCEINGFQIPAKTIAIINLWALGRDEKYWAEASSFIPERFLELYSHLVYKGSDFQFIPFGGGRRICPGISFGIATVEFILAVLLYHFDWKYPGDIKSQKLDIAEKFGISLRKKEDTWLIPTCYLP